MRDIIALACNDCKRRNYSTTKNRKKSSERLEFSKYLPVLPEAHGAQGNEVIAVRGKWRGQGRNVRRDVYPLPLTPCRLSAKRVKASSSIGRAPVSKTGGWGFETLLACQKSDQGSELGTRDPELKTEWRANVVSDNIGEARENVSGRWNRSRVFLVEVRNELKRVTWPTRKEVYAATVVVILFSIVLGVFLWIVDLILDRAVFTLFQRFSQ